MKCDSGDNRREESAEADHRAEGMIIALARMIHDGMVRGEMRSTRDKREEHNQMFEVQGSKLRKHRTSDLEPFFVSRESGIGDCSKIAHK